MSNLAQFAGYREIPLIPNPSEPAFVVGAYGTSGTYVYSHNFQMLGLGLDPSSEFTSSTYYSSNWNGTPSSNSSWSYAGTTHASMHGYIYASTAPGMDTNYGYSYMCFGNYSYGRYCGVVNSTTTGVWVNKTKRDNLCLQRGNFMSEYGNGQYLTRTCISQLGFGAYFSPISSTQDMTGASATGVANGYTNNASYGLIGYNETTKMLVVGNSTGASTNASSFYVYKNVSPPTLANANNNTFWSQLNHGSKILVTFTFPAYNDTVDYQHYKLIPLDNGNIALIYKYANGWIGYRLFVGNDGVNSTSWTRNASDTVQVSTTTSYHSSNFGEQDSLPFTVSYDGKYVFVYTQYYYYLSGICGMIIRVSDGQARVINITDSNYAYSPVMINANDMIISYGVNSDGSEGQYLYCYDIPYLFEVTASNADVTSYRNVTRVNTYYTSTNYGMIWSAQSYLPNFIRGVF